MQGVKQSSRRVFLLLTLIAALWGGLALSGLGATRGGGAALAKATVYGARGVAIDPSNGYVYVANLINNSLSVVPEGSEPATTTALPLCSGALPNPAGVALLPASDRGRLYVSEPNCDQVAAFDITHPTPDPASLTLVATYAVGRQPEGIAVNMATHTAFVANAGDNTVSVLDVSSDSGTVTATLPQASYQFTTPTGVAVDANDTLYVTNNAGSGPGSLSVITNASTTPSLDTTVTVGAGPTGVAVLSPATDPLISSTWVYVANSDDNSLSVVNVSLTNVATVVGTIINPSGKNPPKSCFLAAPTALTIDASANTVYVTNASGNSSQTLGAVTGSVVGLTGATDAAWGQNQAVGGAATVDSVAVRDSPEGIALDPTTTTFVVTNFGPPTPESPLLTLDQTLSYPAIVQWQGCNI